MYYALHTSEHVPRDTQRADLQAPAGGCGRKHGRVRRAPGGVGDLVAARLEGQQRGRLA